MELLASALIPSIILHSSIYLSTRSIHPSIHQPNLPIYSSRSLSTITVQLFNCLTLLLTRPIPLSFTVLHVCDYICAPLLCSCVDLVTVKSNKAKGNLHLRHSSYSTSFAIHRSLTPPPSLPTSMILTYPSKWL